VEAGDLEPAVDLVMLRLCLGRSEDGEAADALWRAGAALARVESLAGAPTNAEEARRRAQDALVHTEDARRAGWAARGVRGGADQPAGVPCAARRAAAGQPGR
jgi:hypothetical protein